MRIDSGHLAAFAAVLDEGTFELAARRLNVTPSAVSQRIKLLEDRLGQVLIRRTTPCEPTAPGRTLLRHARQVALLEFEALAELGAGGEESAARVPVVVNADSLDTWFAGVFDGLAGIAPVTLDIRVEDQDHSTALLREGTVMAGVSASDAAIQGCRTEPLGVMRYLAVASPAFVRRHFGQAVTPEALAAAPTLVFNRKDALQEVFAASVYPERSPKPGLHGPTRKPPIHYAPSTPSFLQAALRSAGWGVMPEQIVSEALASGALVEPWPGRVLDVPLYWRRWRIESRSLDAVTRLVRRAADGGLRQAEA